MNERIKQVRKLKNLSQSAFGEPFGASRDMINNVENGRAAVSDMMIAAICRTYNVNEVWLRTGVGEPFASKSREAEMGELVRKLMADRPEAFRVRLITALLRFDPEGAEWQVLENIYKSVAGEIEKADS